MKQQNYRPNRYKKSGKGGFALAVFLVCIVLLMVGGYLLQRYQHQKTVPPAKTIQNTPAIPQRPAPLLASSSAAAKAAVRQAVEPVPPVKQDYYNGELPPDQQVTPYSQRPESGKAELAVVVDDMGSSLQEARSLAAIGVPINFSIIPGLRHDREVADFAAGQGIKILVHMPMQSKEYPRRRLESNGLLLEQSNEELRSRLLGYLELLPQAVGANNHMGSGFTEDPDKMRVVLGFLKEKKLFYLDSVTTPLTVGPKIATELKMRHARRDVFLDNEQDEGYIRGQLAQAVARARKNGHAIAICHPHPVTIATLTKELPELSKKGVKLVAITRLIK